MPSDLTKYNGSHKGHYWRIAIVVVIGLLCLFKSCQSCSRSQELSFYKYNSQNYIDSIEQTIGRMSDTILYLQSKIDVLETELNLYKIENEGLREDKRHLKNVNNVLVTVNNKHNTDNKSQNN